MTSWFQLWKQKSAKLYRILDFLTMPVLLASLEFIAVLLINQYIIKIPLVFNWLLYLWTVVSERVNVLNTH